MKDTQAIRRPTEWLARWNRLFERRSVKITLIVVHLALCALLVLAAGRPYFVLVHWFYFPVLLAAHWFHAPGGLIVGLAAGILASPYVIGNSTPVDQDAFAWAYRTAFYVGIGTSAGFL